MKRFNIKIYTNKKNILKYIKHYSKEFITLYKNYSLNKYLINNYNISLTKLLNYIIEYITINNITINNNYNNYYSLNFFYERKEIIIKKRNEPDKILNLSELVSLIEYGNLELQPNRVITKMLNYCKENMKRQYQIKIYY